VARANGLRNPANLYRWNREKRISQLLGGCIAFPHVTEIVSEHTRNSDVSLANCCAGASIDGVEERPVAPRHRRSGDAALVCLDSARR
jgi:hypothetical protein